MNKKIVSIIIFLVLGLAVVLAFNYLGLFDNEAVGGNPQPMCTGSCKIGVQRPDGSWTNIQDQACSPVENCKCTPAGNLNVIPEEDKCGIAYVPGKGGKGKNGAGGSGDGAGGMCILSCQFIDADIIPILVEGRYSSRKRYSDFACPSPTNILECENRFQQSMIQNGMNPKLITCGLDHSGIRFTNDDGSVPKDGDGNPINLDRKNWMDAKKHFRDVFDALLAIKMLERHGNNHADIVIIPGDYDLGFNPEDPFDDERCFNCFYQNEVDRFNHLIEKYLHDLGLPADVDFYSIEPSYLRSEYRDWMIEKYANEMMQRYNPVWDKGPNKDCKINKAYR